MRIHLKILQPGQKFFFETYTCGVEIFFDKRGRRDQCLSPRANNFNIKKFKERVWLHLKIHLTPSCRIRHSISYPIWRIPVACLVQILLATSGGSCTFLGGIEKFQVTVVGAFRQNFGQRSRHCPRHRVIDSWAFFTFSFPSHANLPSDFISGFGALAASPRPQSDESGITCIGTTSSTSLI